MQTRTLDTIMVEVSQGYDNVLQPDQEQPTYGNLFTDGND
jgi:hypothetical protein